MKITQRPREISEYHSWKKLIQCFRDVQLNSLARDLELHFGLPLPSDRGKVIKQGDTLPAVMHEDFQQLCMRTSSSYA